MEWRDEESDYCMQWLHPGTEWPKKEKVWDSGKTEAPTQERGKETSQNKSEEKSQGDSWAAAGLEQSVQVGAGG